MPTLPYQTDPYSPLGLATQRTTQPAGTTAPKATSANVAPIPGAKVDPNQQNAQVLATGQQRAIQGYQSPTLNMTSQKTQQLLQNPGQGYNYDQAKTMANDQYNRSMSDQMEALRQQTATVSNTGQNKQDLLGVALQIGQGRVDNARKTEMEVAQKKQDDLIKALAEGRATTATESGIHSQNIADLMSVRQGAEGEENRKFQGSENAIDRGLQLAIKNADTESQAYLTELKSRLDQMSQDDQQQFLSSESTLDRQLQREIESGRLTLEEKELAQNASQFDSKLDFDRWATQQGLDQQVADRVWQSSEQALDRAATLKLTEIQNAFEARNLDFQAFMGQLQNMPGTQAAQVMMDIGNKLGMNIKPLSSSEQAQEAVDVVMPKLQTGEKITAEEFAAIKSSPQWQSIPTKSQIPSMEVKYDSHGLNAWRLSNEAKTWLDSNPNALIKGDDGQLYRIASYYQPSTNDWSQRNTRATVTLENVVTGATQTWR